MMKFLQSSFLKKWAKKSETSRCYSTWSYKKFYRISRLSCFRLGKSIYKILMQLSTGSLLNLKNFKLYPNGRKTLRKAITLIISYTNNFCFKLKSVLEIWVIPQWMNLSVSQKLRKANMLNKINASVRLENAGRYLPCLHLEKRLLLSFLHLQKARELRQLNQQKLKNEIWKIWHKMPRLKLPWLAAQISVAWRNKRLCLSIICQMTLT